MTENEFRSFTISTLIGKLHSAILSVTKVVKEIAKKNDKLSFYDIRALRDHITKRLNANEDIEDNEKLLELLDLFSTDKEVIELIRDEAEEWATLLQAIEDSLIRRQESLTMEERKELDAIIKLTRDIKELIRS